MHNLHLEEEDSQELQEELVVDGDIQWDIGDRLAVEVNTVVGDLDMIVACPS